MKRIVFCLLAVVIFAAPCAYDAFSPEPSPFTGLVAVATVAGNSGR
ncbi:hypothetical protein QO002_006132 [Pararhizobium capsulatum DSM 1112]|uniref:Lipoprotein n=1 Tax=Pararhizobium capsulatum DSM 1112 TaxID=1121113 RepID=A0ABU0C075_9HYPH|nr:hypothetical protein [Pararhizobium capsulatum]MDQ0323925.1 hypothetical protein [Pararhizobium capsulatum DSM 1112]